MELWKKITLAMFFVLQFRLLVITPLRELADDVQFVWQVWDFVWQKLRSSTSLATIVVYALRGALSALNAFLVDPETPKSDGCTQANLFGAGLIVAMVAVDLGSGLLVGSMLATVSLLLVSAFISKGSPEDAVFLSNPISMLFCYNVSSGLVAVLLTVHSYLGLAPETYVMLTSALLLLPKSIKRGRLSWSDDFFPVPGWACGIYVLWKILSALAMAIHLESWLSFQTAFNLFIASFWIIAFLFDSWINAFLFDS